MQRRKAKVQGQRMVKGPSWASNYAGQPIGRPANLVYARNVAKVEFLRMQHCSVASCYECCTTGLHTTFAPEKIHPGTLMRNQ